MKLILKDFDYNGKHFNKIKLNLGALKDLDDLDENFDRVIGLIKEDCDYDMDDEIIVISKTNIPFDILEDLFRNED